MPSGHFVRNANKPWRLELEDLELKDSSIHKLEICLKFHEQGRPKWHVEILRTNFEAEVARVGAASLGEGGILKVTSIMTHT